MRNSTRPDTKLADPTRRAVLVGAGMAAALGAIGPALAAGQERKRQGPKTTKLIDAVQHCEAVGEACLAHIFEVLKGGDTSLAECGIVVDEMIAVCAATAKLALNGSANLKPMLGVCKQVGQDCEKECRKHAQKHAICKEMADACQATIQACDKVLA